MLSLTNWDFLHAFREKVDFLHDFFEKVDFFACLPHVGGMFPGENFENMIENYALRDIMMEHFENKALLSFHSPPKFWGRYVDDYR